MRDNLTKSCFVHKFEQLVKMLNDQSMEVTGIRIITPGTILVSHKARSTENVPMSKDTNIFIAVITTAWARMRIFEELDKLGERIIYCDTDSVVYERSDVPAKNLETGPFLGQMTDELDEGDSISEFCSGGPKNYAYRTKNGKAVVKVKGFTLNAVNATAFSFENLKKVILSGVENSTEDEPNDAVVLGAKRVNSHHRCSKKENTEIRQQLFQEHLAKGGSHASAIASSEGISCFNPTRIFRSRDFKVLKKAEQKMYMFYFDKRIVLDDYNTVPYGYVGRIG